MAWDPRRPERKPRWRVGDWVTSFSVPVRTVVKIIEYRGPLSHDGMPMYRLREVDEYGTVREFEQREDSLEPYDGPIPAAPAPAGLR